MREWLSRSENSKLLQECLPRFEFSEALLKIVIGRGVETPLDVYNYFHPRLSRLHSPFMMKGMYEAVDLIKKAFDAEKQIVVFTDSDLDGITGLSVLYSLLKRIGVTPQYRFPVGEESYGLTREIVSELRDRGGELLVTIDSGIKDVDEIAYARSLGMETIVTDHHEPDAVLPDGILLNPKIDKCNYPFKYLAGAGVIFKFCHAILLSYLPSFKTIFYLINRRENSYHVSTVRDGVLLSSTELYSINEVTGMLEGGSIAVAATGDVFDEIEKNSHKSTLYQLGDWLEKTSFSHLNEAADVLGIPAALYASEEDLFYDIFSEVQLRNTPRLLEFLKDVLGNVAIGNIADIMPLEEENRILTFYGIKSLNATSHPGLGQLTDNMKVDSKAIGWDIAPILNSPGRFGEAELTASFFLSENIESIKEIVVKVKNMNEHRKKIVQKTCGDIINQIDTGEIPGDSNFLFLYCDDIPDGLAGLIANRLADKYNKPAIIATRNREGVKGSGRAPGNFNFLSIISKYENHFLRIGGHAQAFGFTIEEEELIPVIEKLRKESFIDSDEDPVIFDMNLPVKNVSLELAEELLFLGPCGRGNEEPLFKAEGEKIERFSRFGKDKSHGKYIIEGKEFIGWGSADEMEKFCSDETLLDLLYTVEINSFRGRKQLRLLIKEMKPNSGN